mmetsp:Transcript_9397/g.29158  ORF Transcript_9397/g.29158 Transcript_9397/m.29158 type:complete len:317 (-) Transcript_9397:22-972(-)
MTPAYLPLVTLAELAKCRGTGAGRFASIWASGAFALALPRETSHVPPFDAVRRLFDAGDAVLGRGGSSDADTSTGTPTRSLKRFWRGLISPESREHLSLQECDRKRTIDLTLEALHSRRLLRRLGNDFEVFQQFVEAQLVHGGIVPALAAHLEQTFGMAPAVLTGHRMHRLLDYREEASEIRGPRCQPHRDYGTFTVLWSDHLGLEVFRRRIMGQHADEFCDEWAEAPPGAAAVVVVGRALSVLTGGRAFAPEHRVVARPSTVLNRVPRRTALALFVEPAKTQILHPVGFGGEHQTPGIIYGELKQRMRLEHDLTL